MRSGQLVDDKLVIDVINNVKKDAKYSKHLGLILDGVPRTIPQASMLRDSGTKIDLLINFYNREEVLLEKLMGRRVCPSCNRNYNIAEINTEDGYHMKPLLPKKKADECDDCPGVKLVVRDDDKELIIRDRLKVYKEKTEPILEYYRQHANGETKIIDFEAKKGKDDYPAIKVILKETLKI